MSRGNLGGILYPVCQFCHHRLNEFGGCDNCKQFLQEALAAKPVCGKSVYLYDGKAYEVDENFNPPIVKEIKGEEEE